MEERNEFQNELAEEQALPETDCKADHNANDGKNDFVHNLAAHLLL